MIGGERKWGWDQPLLKIPKKEIHVDIVNKLLFLKNLAC